MSLTIYQEVQILLDEAVTPTFWTPTQIYNAVNRAQLDLYTNVKFTNISAPLNILTAQQLLPLPPAVMIPQYIVTDQNLKCFPTTHALLEDWSINWFNEPPAKPQWVVLWDWNTLRLFPQPDQPYTFTLYGVPYPSEVGPSNLDINIDNLARRAIISYAGAYLMELTRPDLADAFRAEGLEYEKRWGRQQRNQQGDNVLRLRPGVGWSVAQMGDIKEGRKYTSAPLSGPF